MPRKKIDGVIEAVRYLPDGKIDSVRAYERRGAVWSDTILLERADLVELLKRGMNFVTGQRKANFGSLLETGQAVRYEKNIISTDGREGARDLLTGVPSY